MGHGLRLHGSDTAVTHVVSGIHSPRPFSRTIRVVLEVGVAELSQGRPPGAERARGRREQARRGKTSCGTSRHSGGRSCAKPRCTGPAIRRFSPCSVSRHGASFRILGPGSAAYTLIHVDDVVRAIETAARAETVGGETFFIGHPEPATAEDLRAALGAATGSAPRPLRLPSPLTWIVAGVGDLGRRVGRPTVLDLARWRELTAPGFVCSVDRARDRLGFEARIGRTMAEAPWWNLCYSFSPFSPPHEV